MKQRHQGFTLVELMVTLAAAIILLAVGIPFFGGIVANNRAAAQANGLVTALSTARSEAVGRADDMTVRPNGSDDWTDGWIVFVDQNADGLFDVGTDEVLRQWEAPAGSATIALSSGNSVTFDSSGATGSPAVGFDMDQPDATGLARRCVTVTITGQVRTTREDPDETWSCP